jgi:hypothetical protein
MPSHSGSDPAHEGQHSQRHERPGQCRGPSPLLPVHRCPPVARRASPVPRPVTNRGEVLAARGPSARGRRGPVTCRHHERAGGFRTWVCDPAHGARSIARRPRSCARAHRVCLPGPRGSAPSRPIPQSCRSTGWRDDGRERFPGFACDTRRTGPGGGIAPFRNGVPRTRPHHAGRRWHWGCSGCTLELDDAASAAGTAVAVKRSPRWRAIGAARW